MPKGMIPETDELVKAYQEADDLQKEALKAQYRAQIQQVMQPQMTA
jgi:hypothetical protein